MATITDRPMRSLDKAVLAHLPAVIGLALLIIPSLISLMRDSWTTEAGVHGPIVLATGVWLIARRRKEIAAIRSPGSSATMFAMIVPALLVYAFARAFDFLSVEIASLAVVLVAVLYGYYGAEAVKRLWFPIVYLCFMIPLPLWFIDTVTAPLKEFVSWAASGLLEMVGYPIVRQGVTLYVAQYQLLVEDACAGLNSLVSLTAISLFYIYLLHNATWRYSLMLVAWIIPLAILANVIRIIILVLLTYHFGDAAAQGFLHSTAGLVMFATALLGIFLVDGVTQAVQRRFGWGSHR
jgi:exosortase B